MKGNKIWIRLENPTRGQNGLGHVNKTKGFPGDSVVKNPPANVGDAGSIPGSGRSLGVGNGNPFQYPSLDNPIEAWRAPVHGVAKSPVGFCDTHTHIATKGYNHTRPISSFHHRPGASGRH